MQLTALLHVDDVSPRELRVVVTTHFGRVRREAANTLAYLRDAEVALAISYEMGRAVSIVPGPALDESDLVQLEARLQDALVDVGRKVRREIGFAGVPVIGLWRYRELFQIVTAPDDAPRPPPPMGGNPFVLEVSCADSPDAPVAMDRADQALTEVNLLLAAFVPWIEAPQPRGLIEQQWAIPVGEPVTGPIWTQKAYIIEGFLAVADTLTPPPGPEVRLVDEPILYARRGLSGGASLELPTSIELMFDRYYRLESNRRERFLRWLIGSRIQARLRAFRHRRATWRRSKPSRPCDPAGAPVTLAQSAACKRGPGRPANSSTSWMNTFRARTERQRPSAGRFTACVLV